MDRSEIQYLIVQSIQGELSPEDEARLARILRESPEARGMYDELKKVWGFLDAWEAPEPPADLARCFSARLAKESRGVDHQSLLKKLKTPHRSWIRLRLGWNIAGLGLAAALALGIFHIFSSQISTPLPESSPTLLVMEETPVAAVMSAMTPAASPLRPTPAAIRAMPTRGTITRVEYNRIAPTGVYVERLPNPDHQVRQANFAVHNFSTDIPEINTQHNNTIMASYENPL